MKLAPGHMDDWSLTNIFRRVTITEKAMLHFLRCPRFWLPAPPQGMNPGARTYGMKADPSRYLWPKYECFLIWDCQDISILRNINVKLWCNSTNVTEARMHEHTNGKTKTIYYTPWHKCLGYNDTLIMWNGETCIPSLAIWILLVSQGSNTAGKTTK